MESQPKLIFYIDDDPDDREFLYDALKKEDPEVEVLFAENGLVALERLREMKKNRDPLPSLIVLDVNMPFLDGKETFQRLKQDDALQTVPIIVLSSSESPNDKALFNNLGIEYFIKPSDLKYMDSIASHMMKICC